jgi:hypothetical protein
MFISGGNQSSKQLIKRPALTSPTLRQGSTQVGWIAAFVMVPAFLMLGVILWRLEGDKGWRDQAEGLRERLEQEGHRSLGRGRR